jgi:2-polyprenyl-6-methoxyphenol hydroxylase-like FAD-dependent oxidoreductase
MNGPADVSTKDLKQVRDVALKEMQDVQCPAEIIDIVRDSDPESLNFVTEFWYRPPWEVVFGNFQKGTVTVAGDAMHAMGPFIGQGGSAGLEDAVVLARSLARAVDDADGAGKDAPAPAREKMIGEAIGEYIRERRPRVALLSLESFIMGALLVRSPSPVTKLACVAVLILLGSKSLRHAHYDCGRL